LRRIVPYKLLGNTTWHNTFAVFRYYICSAYSR